jgi:endonuclease/exonuclease/phosphatase family metal-dependent hydrolase
MRLATFNVLHGRSIDDGLVDRGRLADAARSLDADVLALQEVDRDQARSGGLDVTAAVAGATGALDSRFVPTLTGTPGFDWSAAALDEPPGAPAYGIGLVSRLPVQEWVPLALGASPARLPVVIEGPRRRVLLVKDEPRVAVAAVLAAGTPVRTVVATHLSFAPGWNLVQLRRLARATRALPRPLVLLGDLNIPGRVVRTLPGWRSLARVPTYPAPSPRVQLDHVLLRTAGSSGPTPVVQTFAAVRTPISDHRALVVDVADR